MAMNAAWERGCARAASPGRPVRHHQAGRRIEDPRRCRAAHRRSLRLLGLDHVDLLLIHSPQPWAEFREGGEYDAGNLEAWQALENALAAGKVRAIGVSNFERADIDNLLAHGSVAPAVNQVLAHVGATPFDLIDDCRSKGLLVQAYSPVAHGAALHDTALLEMAARYGVGVAQLCIRYCLQLGLQPLPKTANPAHLRSNASLDFMISEADMATLKGADGTDYGEASAFPVFGKKRRPSPVAGG
jgi:diketogulonate reductase-like aldo/keto reductase